MIRSYRGRWPQIAASAYIDPAAVVIGDVTIGEQSSVWPCVVIRGDVHWIRIGARSNVQDVSTLHVMKDEYPLTLGDNVTVGHMVMLHGCTIGEGTLIGIQAIVMNGAVIGKGCLVGAGALITERKVFADGCLIIGAPAKVVRQLSAEEREDLLKVAANYAERGAFYSKHLHPV